MAKTLVAYFSASGVTAKVAKQIAEISGSDIFEIKPLHPYNDYDLNWMDKNSRSSVEMKNTPEFRPEMAEKKNNMRDYSIIFIGFPIWWYIAPTIVNTFLESFDANGKIIIPFATSMGSAMGKTNESLAPSAKGATLLEGKVFKKDVSVEELSDWIHSYHIL